VGDSKDRPNEKSNHIDNAYQFLTSFYGGTIRLKILDTIYIDSFFWSMY
jgi:hypothetical protein